MVTFCYNTLVTLSNILYIIRRGILLLESLFFLLFLLIAIDASYFYSFVVHKQQTRARDVSRPIRASIFDCGRYSMAFFNPFLVPQTSDNLVTSVHG